MDAAGLFLLLLLPPFLLYGIMTSLSHLLLSVLIHVPHNRGKQVQRHEGIRGSMVQHGRW